MMGRRWGGRAGVHVLVLVLVLVLALVLAGLGAGCSVSVPPSQPHPVLAQPLPARSLDALDGRTVKVPAAGKVTLIDVWATSCKPCVEAMPAIEALHRDFKARGLVVVGVATDDNPGLVRDFAAKLGVTYPNVVDGGGDLQAAWRAPKIPQTMVVDRRGTVRFVVVGGGRDDIAKVEQAVRALLEE